MINNTASNINTLIDSCKDHLNENDLKFAKRVYATSSEIYENRLRAIGFNGMDIILDAGCGFGQWTFALAKLNQKIKAIDYAEERIMICKKIQQEDTSNLGSINFDVGTIEKLSYDDETVDAVFCYGVIFIADFRKALREFYRVLKKGGKLYVCVNDTGRYIFNLLNDPNPTSNYSAKARAVKVIENSINFYSMEKREIGIPIIIPVSFFEKTLIATGFKDIVWDGEGRLNLHGVEKTKSFFPKEYMELIDVYEVLATK